MRIGKMLLLSLCLHAVFMLTLVSMPVPHWHDQDLIEMSIIEAKDPNSQQTPRRQQVRHVEVPEENKVQASNDLTRFLSLDKVRVKKETRAELNGLTENRSAGQMQKQAARPVAKSLQPPQKQINPYDTGLAVRDELQKWQPQTTVRDRMAGISTSSDALPENIQIGQMTALNTDRSLYYTFFARIQEQVYHRWEAKVRNAIDQAMAQRVIRGSNTEWVTQAVIWLKPTGEFHSAQIMKESGIKGFDSAAIRAFEEAKMFPHPPREMVGDNGLIKIDYAFYVNFDPRTYASRRDLN